MEKLKEIFKKFDKKAMNMSDFKYTLSILGISFFFYLVTFPIVLSTGDMDVSIIDDFVNTNLFVIFMTLVIIVPLLETIIFHSFPLWIYTKIRDKFNLHIRWDFVVGIGLGIFFGYLHGVSYASIIKFLNFIIVGSLFSYTYFRYRRLDKKGWLGIFIIHAINNLVAFLLLATAL